jgi:hypothetical protein
MSTAVEIATVEIDLQGRWDALELSQRLSPYHSFLVQYKRGRWSYARKLQVVTANDSTER